VDGGDDVTGTTVMLMANSPALSGPLLAEDVVPDTTSTVHWEFLAVNVEPVSVTVVDGEGFEAPVSGVDPDWTLLMVYPADCILDW
jgi:hypothetical protein